MHGMAWNGMEKASLCYPLPKRVESFGTWKTALVFWAADSRMRLDFQKSEISNEVVSNFYFIGRNENLHLMTEILHMDWHEVKLCCYLSPGASAFLLSYSYHKRDENHKGILIYLLLDCKQGKEKLTHSKPHLHNVDPHTPFPSPYPPYPT